MSNQNPLPEDQQRARLIDEANRSGRQSVRPDAFLNTLFSLGDDLPAGHRRTAKHQEDDWRVIERHMENHQQKRSSGKAVFYASFALAAMLMITILGGIFLLITQQQAVIYESGETRSAFTLEDGTNVVLRQHSVLEEIPSDGFNRAWNLTGEAWFEVASSDLPFLVKTPQADVRVTGTAFNLSTWGNTSRLFLESGSLTLSAALADESRVMRPGEKAEVGNTGFLVFPEPHREQLSLGWKTDQLIFENRTFGSIAEELSFHFNISVVAGEAVKRQTLSGTILLADKQTAFSDLERVLGGQFVSSGSDTYRFEPFE